MLPMPPTAEEGDAAAAMQALAAVAEAEEAARRSDQSGYEEPPSYEAAMGGNIWGICSKIFYQFYLDSYVDLFCNQEI